MDTPALRHIPVIPFAEDESKGGQDLLIAIGRVTSMFQGIEYALSETYLTFFPRDAHDSAAIAYHTVRMIEGRVAVVSALVEHFCEPPTVDEWKRLVKCIKSRAAVRNEAAHGIPCIIGDAPNRKWAITPSPYDIEDYTGSLDLNRYYTAKELEESALATQEVTKRLSAFGDSLLADTALRVKLASQQTAAQNSAQTPIILRQHPAKP